MKKKNITMSAIALALLAGAPVPLSAAGPAAVVRATKSVITQRIAKNDKIIAIEAESINQAELMYLYENQAALHLAMNNFDETVKYAHKVLELNPQHADAKAVLQMAQDKVGFEVVEATRLRQVKTAGWNSGFSEGQSRGLASGIPIGAIIGVGTWRVLDK